MEVASAQVWSDRQGIARFKADGAHGLAQVKRCGGVAVVQDPGTAERHEMPAAALAVTAADAVLPLSEIGPFLYGLVCPPAGFRVET